MVGLARVFDQMIDYTFICCFLFDLRTQGRPSLEYETSGVEASRDI